MAGRKLRRPDLTIAVADHNIPTVGPRSANEIREEDSRIQVQTLEANVKEFGVPYIPILDVRQGIVHIIGPELGLSLPGTTIVCGDSHTSTHGAMGALAFGIGTSEVEHVMATQTLLQNPARNMRIDVSGTLGLGCTAKDIRAGDHWQNHHGGRHRPRHRIHRRHHPRAGHGRAHDRFQHVDRGGRPRRPGRPGPDHVRLHPRPRVRPQGRGVRTGGRPLEDPADRPRRPLRHRGVPEGRRHRAHDHLGHHPRRGDPRHRRRPRPRRRTRRGQARAVAADAGLHGPDAGPTADRRGGGRGVHRVPAPTAASRTSARRRKSPRAARSRRACRRWSSPARAS